MPLVGTVVFDGELDLDDYTISVGDVERLGRWTQRIERTGVQRVVVQVDDPGYASRVHVGLGIGTDVRALPSVSGPALFSVLTGEVEALSRPTERGLVLDGHDSPHARLSAAIRLLSDPDPTKPWLERYEAQLIAEWMRWLGIDLTNDRAQELGAELTHLVHTARVASSGHRDGISSVAADRIAATLLGKVT